MEDNWETYLTKAGQAIEIKETYQEMIGIIVSEFAEKYGDKAIEEFSVQLFETTGRKVAPSTLRNYRWVHEKLGKLNVPADVPYRAKQMIASSKTPEEWVKKLIENGWSGSQIIHEIRVAENKLLAPKTICCPKCGETIEIKK